MTNNVQKQDKKYSCKAIVPVVIFMLYMVLDYFNVPGFFGLSVNRINIDFFDAFLNTVIVVVLYIITYYFVDRRQIQKDSNSRDTADMLLLYTYKECQDYLKMVYDAKWVEEYIIPKVDGNVPPNENKVIFNIQNNPFASKEEVLELAKNGYIDKEALSAYLQIQKEYKHVVSLKIILFDLIEPQNEKQQAMLYNIRGKEQALNLLLEEEIERLEGLK